MPPRRFPNSLVALVAFFLGLSTYITVSVLAGEGDRFVFPESVPIDGGSTEDSTAEPIEAHVAIALDVEVNVRARVRLLPPLGHWEADCRLVAGDEVLDAPAVFIAGPRSVDPTLRDRGRHLVRFERGHGSFLYRIVTMPQGGQRDVPVGSELFFGGRVVTRGGQAIAGAEVWAGTTVAGVRQTVRTDADGRFSITVLAGPSIPVTVSADGWASQYRVVQVDGVQDRDFVFQLDPSASVMIQFAAQVAEPQRGRVFVLPGSDSVSVALTQYPFFLHGIGDGLALDASGACKITDLPRDVEIAIVIQHPQAASVLPVRHRSGTRSVRPVVVQMGRGPELIGRVVDVSGKPIADALVMSRLPNQRVRSTHALLPAGALEVSASRMRTDANGRFRIRRAADDCLVTASAPQYCGAQVLSRSPSEGQTYDFVLPAASSMNGAPQLRFTLPGEGRPRRVRVVHGNGPGSVYLWSDATPFSIDLECMALVDVEVMITDRATDVRRRVLSETGLAVLGPVAFDLER